MSIVREDIDAVEKFVREQLLQLFEKNCIQFNKNFEEDDKAHIFGVYESMPENFRFLKGDRNSILTAVEAVKKRFTSEESKQKIIAQYMCPNDYAISKPSKVDKLSVGLFFGKKNRVRLPASLTSNDKIVDELFYKAENLFQTNIKAGSKPTRPITKDIAKVEKIGDGFIGKILCVFCPCNGSDNMLLHKWFCVQCEMLPSSTMYCWNFGNFRKHLKRSHSIDNNNVFIYDYSINNLISHYK